MHRSLLLPIGHVDLPEEKPKPAPRKSMKVTRRSQLNISQHDGSALDTNSDEIMVYGADSIAQNNERTPALIIESSLANEEDSAEDEGETGTSFT